MLTMRFNSWLYYLLGVGDEILNCDSKNFQLFFGGDVGLEVEELRAAKRIVGYFMLNLMT